MQYLQEVYRALWGILEPEVLHALTLFQYRLSVISIPSSTAPLKDCS